MKELVQEAKKLNKRALGQLVSIFEDKRVQGIDGRLEALRWMGKSKGKIIGITGAPGVGKSTLIGKLAEGLAASANVAVVAVDPSSHVSGGSLLGDRTRVRFQKNQERIFFRSQASDLSLGGVAETTFQVCRCLAYFFDYVLVETVGVGQSEIEVKDLADRVYLIVQPQTGDQIQFLKAGVMEIPNAIVMNKMEMEGASVAFAQLQGTSRMTRILKREVPLFGVSALEGEGLSELIEDMKSVEESRNEERLLSFLKKWVVREYGRYGTAQVLRKWPEWANLWADGATFEGAQRLVNQLLSPE